MAKKEIPPYHLRVLTSEYLVEGTVYGDANLYFPNKPDALLFIHFGLAKIRPIRSSDAAILTFDDYILNTGAALAYIPDTDITLLPGYEGWKYYKVPNSGIFQLGPYSMTGRLMTMTAKNITPLTTLMLDVHITCTYPDAKWVDMDAPAVLLNPCELHGCKLG